MPKPTAQTIAWFDAAVPPDPRAVRGQMFGNPCASVNGNMFICTFGESVILRLGEKRVATIAATGPGTVFEPLPARPWKDYVQFAVKAVPGKTLATIAGEAFEFTDALPAKAAKAKKPRTAKPRAAKPGR